MESDARVCERIVRSHARTFTLASVFLSAPRRRAAYALYAFCRTADDLVDVGARGDASEAAARLVEYERGLAQALAGRPTNAVFRELLVAVRTYHIPHDVLWELLAGVARDLAPARYDRWSDLATYCGGVASTVGEMCAHVFGVDGGADEHRRALRYARVLGVAMQLTNILRDVGEDARIGRCYLPAEDLATFGIDVDEVLTNPDLADDERWAPFVAFEIGRARSLYEAAIPGIALLSRDARRCALACATGYATILDALEGIGYDSLRRRARPGAVTRASTLWRAALGATSARERGTGGPALPWEPIGALASRGTGAA